MKLEWTDIPGDISVAEARFPNKESSITLTECACDIIPGNKEIRRYDLDYSICIKGSDCFNCIPPANIAFEKISDGCRLPDNIDTMDKAKDYVMNGFLKRHISVRLRQTTNQALALNELLYKILEKG